METALAAVENENVVMGSDGQTGMASYSSQKSIEMVLR